MTSPVSLPRTFKEALANAGIPVAVAGLDISFNEHLTDAFDPHWLLHIRAHVPGRLFEYQITDFRTHFPAEVRILKPLTVSPFDGNLRGLAYTMKAEFERRQSYDQVKRTTDGSRNCRNTRSRPIRGKDAVELALFLDRIGLRRRLILHGARLVQTSTGRVVIQRKTD